MRITDMAFLMRLDALGLHVTLDYADHSGAVLARVPSADIRKPSIISSLGGVGEDAAEALADLWSKIDDLQPDEWLRVERPGQPNRYYRWNGQAWKERPTQPGEGE